MADAPRIAATTRTEFGKGAARRVRRAHQIPAVLYGHGTDPVHLCLPGHEMMMITKTQNAVVNLDVEGTEQLALVKDVQRDPVRSIIEHIDLILVRKGEKVSVEVPVFVVGEAATGIVVSQELSALKVLADASTIPAQFEIALEDIEGSAIVRAADVPLPEGVVLEEDPEAIVVTVTAHETELVED